MGPSLSFERTVIRALVSRSVFAESLKHRNRGATSHLNPHFHFETLPPNLWIIAIINIHAGVKAMKTLWR